VGGQMRGGGRMGGGRPAEADTLTVCLRKLVRVWGLLEPLRWQCPTGATRLERGLSNLAERADKQPAVRAEFTDVNDVEDGLKQMATCSAYSKHARQSDQMMGGHRFAHRSH